MHKINKEVIILTQPNKFGNPDGGLFKNLYLELGHFKQPPPPMKKLELNILHSPPESK